MPAPVTASVADLRTGPASEISRASAAIASLLGSLRRQTPPAVCWGPDEIVWTDNRLRENTLRANRYDFVLHRRQRNGAADDNVSRGVPQNHPATPVIENAVASLYDALSHGRPVHTWHRDYGLESLVTWTDEHGKQPGIGCHGGRICTKPEVLWRPHTTEPEGHLNAIQTKNEPTSPNEGIPAPPESEQTCAETHRQAMELATQAFMTRMTDTPETSVPLFRTGTGTGNGRHQTDELFGRPHLGRSAPELRLDGRPLPAVRNRRQSGRHGNGRQPARGHQGGTPNATGRRPPVITLNPKAQTAGI